MNNKSLKNNILLYVIKQISAILFPMIIYPYVARKLGVDGIGKVEYAKSITQYFVLFSGLGIFDYAVREGARIREKKKEFNQFATQILMIHTISTIISVSVCYLISFFSVFLQYQKLIFIFSLMIPFGTIGFNWIFGVFEEYEYIAKRTIIVQFVSAILVFMIVHEKEDYICYAIILVLSSVGANIMNLAQIYKFFKLDFKNLQIRKHLKSIFLIFGMTLASNLYMTMDTSMLGFLDGTMSVGYYSAANKLVIVIGTLLGAVRTVLLPRLSNVIANNKDEEFKQLNSITLNIIIIFAIPVAFGIWCLSNEIIILFCGSEFVNGGKTLKILVPEIVLSAMNGYLIYQIYMPLKHEDKAFFCILAGAVTNLITNIILIPILHQNGAAVATCISEGIVFAFALMLGKKQLNEWIDYKFFLIELIKCLFSGMIMFILCMLIKTTIRNYVIIMFAIPIIGAFMYFTILIAIKEKLVSKIIKLKLD